jgi:hypothetical protein
MVKETVFCERPVGNGGFSLRKISTFYKLCSRKILFIGFLHSVISKCKYYSSKCCFFPAYPLFYIPLILVKKIVLKFFPDSGVTTNNEDEIWSNELYTFGYLPSQIEAAKFSFENYPEYLFGLNNNKLPFGCHRWEFYYNFLFWKDYIKFNE